MKLVISIAALVLIGTTFVGCSSRSETKSIQNTQTLGQELLDLQKARASGALTDAEYEDMKDKLLRQRTHS
jgi:hypothetical protein